MLLLEAGDEEPFVTAVPAFSPFLLLRSSLDWDYKTLPEPMSCKAFKNSECDWTRGKVMGGSSSINLMLHTRGLKKDYDEWSELGNIGWSYDEVLPYFEKLEGIYNNSKV